MLTKQEFKEAFIEAMEIQLAADLKESEPHEFTPGFESRMEELIKTGDIKRKRTGMKRGMRILLIAAAIVLALAAVACAVPEIRESIAGFFVKVFGDHVEYSDPNVTKESIEEEYGLVPMPEGFVETDSSSTFNDRVHIYQNESGDSIVLQQSNNKHIVDAVDNENGSFIDLNIDGNNVRIYLPEVGAVASWLEDGYYFSLAYSSPIELNQFEEWIASVDIIEE